MNTTYAYQDTNRNTVMIDESNVNFTGTWSSSGTYTAADYDAAIYGAARYIAIVDNVGGVPTYVPRRGQAKWSSLVLIRQGSDSGGHTADEAYTLALQASTAADVAVAVADAATVVAEQADVVAGVALSTAWAGTAAAEAASSQAASASGGADAAFAIAVAGTNAVASAAATAQQQAYTALLAAWSGTNGANAALAVAVRGTNAAAIAEAHASTGLQTAWAGTQTANQALDLANHLVTWFGTVSGGGDTSSGSAFAYDLFIAGTNYANGQVAIESDARMAADAALAQQSFDFFVAGSNYTNAIVLQAGFFIRDSGTTYTDEQVGIAHHEADANAYALYIAGTNYTNSTAFEAGSEASQLVFWAGTNYTNLRVGAETDARINGDNSIIAIANAGTNAAALANAHAAAALAAAWAGTVASVPLAGGTMTGNLRTPQIFLNSGSIGIGSLQNGTMYYDFLGPAFVETQVDANMMVSAKNFTPGAEIAVCLVSNGQQKQITYDAQFSWFGTQIPATSPTMNNKILAALASTGTIPSKVLGASTPQI